MIDYEANNRAGSESITSSKYSSYDLPRAQHPGGTQEHKISLSVRNIHCIRKIHSHELISKTIFHRGQAHLKQASGEMEILIIKWSMAFFI